MEKKTWTEEEKQEAMKQFRIGHGTALDAFQAKYPNKKWPCVFNTETGKYFWVNRDERRKKKIKL